jgi:hypothetical protein
LLHHSLSVLDGANGALITIINLIENYNPITGEITGPVGVLPIQTPVSPDGKVIVTAATGGQIVISDPATDKMVTMLAIVIDSGEKQANGHFQKFQFPV